MARSAVIAAPSLLVLEAPLHDSITITRSSVLMRRNISRWMLLVAAGCVLQTSSVHAQTVRNRQVGNDLYLMTTGFDFLSGYMNNLVLKGPTGLLLVDDIDAGMYSVFRAGLNQISPDPVQTLINTHWHHDHTGLNADFVVNEGTSRIIAHWKTGEFLAKENYIEDLDATSPALPPEAQPTEVVNHAKLFQQNGEWIALVPSAPNAHSNTDLIVFFLNSNIVHMGDIYFGHMFPFIDRASGGSIKGMIRSCKIIAAMINDQTLVVPSHGPVGDRAALVEYTAMLETVQARIQAIVDQGMSEQEAVAAKPLADLEAVGWGWFFVTGDLFTTVVYRDLAN
jgi:cyclase